MTKFLCLRMCGYAAHPLEWIGGAVSTEHLFERAYTEAELSSWYSWGDILIVVE